MNFKRKSSRRKVKCTMCTPWRWMGNSNIRLSHRDKKRLLVEVNVDKGDKGIVRIIKRAAR